MKYAIRIPASESLERDIAKLLPRPVGRPSQKPLIEYKAFLHLSQKFAAKFILVMADAPKPL